MRSLLGLLLLLHSSSIVAGNLDHRYFVLVFGYETELKRPIDTHTFASFVDGGRLERGEPNAVRTVSWLPRNGIVKPFLSWRGRNFDLGTTLQMAKDHGYKTKLYGPYEIDPELYRRGLEQAADLEAGKRWYRMLGGPHSVLGINCIHAVSNIVGPLYTKFLRGWAASEAVARHLSPLYLSKNVTYPDVVRLIPELQSVVLY